MYSQNMEEKIILDYFRDETGTLLSIGENDGKTFSNALALIERGWKAVLIEPSPEAYKRLCALHAGNHRVTCIRVAIGTYNQKATLHDSGTHLAQGDTSLLSTLCMADKMKWAGTTEFTEVEVDVIDYETLTRLSGCDKFDFITIDAEGMDMEILKQIDLREADCDMLCVEHNGNMSPFTDHMMQYNMKLRYMSPENLIFTR